MDVEAAPAETGRDNRCHAGLNLEARLLTGTPSVDDPARQHLGLRAGDSSPQQLGGDLHQKLWLVLTATSAKQQAELIASCP